MNRGLIGAAAALTVVGVVATAGWAFLSDRTGADRTARAEEVYTRRCAYCHEEEGAIGVRLDERVLSDYGTARRLFDYVRLAMPYDAPRTMADEELWLTVEHLLRSRGLVDEGVHVDADNADELEL